MASPRQILVPKEVSARKACSWDINPQRPSGSPQPHRAKKSMYWLPNRRKKKAHKRKAKGAYSCSLARDKRGSIGTRVSVHTKFSNFLSTGRVPGSWRLKIALSYHFKGVCYKEVILLLGFWTTPTDFGVHLDSSMFLAVPIWTVPHFCQCPFG